MGRNNARNSWDHVKRGRKYQIWFHADGVLLLMVFLHTYLNAVIKLNSAKWSLLSLKGTGASWQVAEIKLKENSPDFFSSSS